MKVHELAKELNIESKELISIAQDLNIECKSHLSTLEDIQVEEIISFVKEKKTNNEEKVEKTIVKTNKIEPKIQEQWKPDLNRMICIKNISNGGLIYKSKRQIGYTIQWDRKGSKNYMELGEFISLKNTDRRFVTEPWIRILEDDEIEILRYANIYQYYKEILDIENVEEVLQMPFERFKTKFDNLPVGFKDAIVEHAAEMIKNGMLDSIKIKEYIEKKMEIDLSILTKYKSRNKNDYIDF